MTASESSSSSDSHATASFAQARQQCPSRAVLPNPPGACSTVTGQHAPRLQLLARASPRSGPAATLCRSSQGSSPVIASPGPSASRYSVQRDRRTAPHPRRVPVLAQSRHARLMPSGRIERTRRCRPSAAAARNRRASRSKSRAPRDPRRSSPPRVTPSTTGTSSSFGERAGHVHHARAAEHDGLAAVLVERAAHLGAKQLAGARCRVLEVENR